MGRIAGRDPDVRRRGRPDLRYQNLYRATATFSGPVTVGHVIEPITAHPLHLSPYGYVPQEFFASGIAHAIRTTSTPSDGRWTIVPTTSASYRTRILVRRPADPARFSGTVVVEWMNVSDGESAPEWDYLNPALMASGDSYVAVSAQALGVEGGTPLLGSPSGAASGGLVHQEPARYGSLHHPGDRYAFDIFDQVGLGLRSPASRALGSLKPRHVVAVGESRAAFYLTTFADTLEPLSRAFDGIFIHSRDGNAVPLNGSSFTSGIGRSKVWIRSARGCARRWSGAHASGRVRTQVVDVPVSTPKRTRAAAACANCSPFGSAISFGGTRGIRESPGHLHVSQAAPCSRV